MMKSEAKYPTWVCLYCGTTHGDQIPIPHLSLWHMGICGVCNGKLMVTQARDFGHLKDSWRTDNEQNN